MPLPSNDHQWLKDFIATQCVDHQPHAALRNLKSGGQSDTYVDMRVAAGHPRALEYLCTAFRCRLPAVKQIAGVAEGALPPYGGILIQLPDDYRGCWVPKGAKLDETGRPYGTGKIVQGIILPGANAVLLEDIISEGTSSLQAAAVLKTQGVNVTCILCVVERDEIGGRAKIEAAGYEFKSLFKLSDFVPNVVYVPPPPKD